VATCRLRLTPASSISSPLAALSSTNDWRQSSSRQRAAWCLMSCSKKGTPKITPIGKPTPPEAEALAARLYAMLPRIRTTDLLSEMV
jgi:hypothetical protein